MTDTLDTNYILAEILIKLSVLESILINNNLTTSEEVIKKCEVFRTEMKEFINIAKEIHSSNKEVN